MEEVSFQAFVKDSRRQRQCRSLIRGGMDGWRKSEGSRFQRDGAVKVKDLFVILRLEGLEG